VFSLRYELTSICQRSVAGLPWRRLCFDPRSVRVRFVVDEVAMGQVSFRALRFSDVSEIPPMLHTHLYLNIAITRRTNVRNLGNLRKAVLLRKSGSV
jgi:hypothetical protein